jgi:hypothetical protein
LHRLSERAAKRPYLALNCAAISPNLVEATLFGQPRGVHRRQRQRAGYFEEASDGTLFLDEIGELPLDLQPKLLRVLENGEFQRIGETTARQSSARIVAATNRDLKKEVREGSLSRRPLPPPFGFHRRHSPPCAIWAMTASSCWNISAACMRPRRICRNSDWVRRQRDACCPTHFRATYANCATSQYA